MRLIAKDSIQMAVATVACLALGSHAIGNSPYETDANTLHLYHFDEEQGPFKDTATGEKSFDLVRNGGAGVMRSLQGFGNALDTRNKSESRAITAKTVPSDTFWDPASRAFTAEALVRMDFDPLGVVENRTARMMILSVDSEHNHNTRAFELCLRPAGVYGTTTPSLEFLRFAGEGEGSRIYPIVAPLPRSGPHAPQRGQWYHVALTYNGEADTADNVKFYWTSLASGAAQANLVQKAKLTHEMPKQPKVLKLAIGNSARSVGGVRENWLGQIDEVRISNIARTADDFMFNPITDNSSPQLISSESRDPKPSPRGGRPGQQRERK